LYKKLEDLNTHHTFKILDGEKNVEVKAMQMNKGLAAIQILKSNTFDFVLTISGHEANTDMFDALKDSSYFTMHIGNKRTNSDYSHSDIHHVISFLDQLIL
jgi:trehalose 6-phosphate synthase/phosphatase